MQTVQGREVSMEEARERWAVREGATAAGCPLRYRPVIVHGPGDGYLVVDLGFAVVNELAEVK